MIVKNDHNERLGEAEIDTDVSKSPTIRKHCLKGRDCLGFSVTFSDLRYKDKNV